MRLLKFTIRNYRSCRYTTLSPKSGLTALIGINGSGKSNILSAILLLKRSLQGDTHYSDIDQKYWNRSHVNTEIDYDGLSILLRGRIYYVTNNKNIDDVFGSELKCNLKNITGKNAWFDFPIGPLILEEDSPFVEISGSRRYLYSERFWLSHVDKDLISGKSYSVLREIFKFFTNTKYYSASQFSDPSRCPVSLELEDGRPRIRTHRDTIDHERFMYDLYQSFRRGSEAYERFRNVIGKEGVGLVDDIKFNEFYLPSNIVVVRTGGKTEKKERKQLVVVPTFIVDGNILSPTQLSEGTFRTIALLYYVITDDSQLLFVEEPEVCIHHGLLSSVISLIKAESRDKQIIISTHSDYVLDHLEPESVVLVSKKDHKGTKASPVNKSMSITDFKALKQYLDESGNLGEYWREGGLSNE